MKPHEFQKRVLDWFERKGRKDLPWQVNPSPYRIWVSEIMLQQTQVSTVIPYFERFVERFPTLEDLAEASIDSILHYWSGLGYYARARNLHKTAGMIANFSEFPNHLDQLIKLPGIGRSTAGAILSMAYHKRAPILDGNVKRVFSRFKSIDGWPGDSRVVRELWQLSDQYTPESRVAEYTQAIMDLGATLCTRGNPACNECPIRGGCSAWASDRVAKFPVPRPKKRTPIRKCYLLVLRNSKDYFYLENRPPMGLWGGLWSFPEFEEKRQLLDWCDAQKVDRSKLSWLSERRHTFSHFHLDYTPVLAYQKNTDLNVMESNRILWYNVHRDNQCGLPAPVSRLLEQLSTEENNDNV